MARRIKKSPIKPEQRRDWLRRFEEQGESPPQIAVNDHYDIRTVRKALDLAKAERETKEARTLVLRNAIEQHYHDLRQYAEGIDSEILGTPRTGVSPDGAFIESALRQHLPRSPLWSLLSRRMLLLQNVLEQRRRLQDAVESAARGHAVLASLARSGLEGVIPGVTAALMMETRTWLAGDADTTFRDRLSYEPAGEGMVSPRFGMAHMGAMEESLARREMPRVRGALADLESRTKTLIEFGELKETLDELKRLEGKIREELAIIRLRRIVPGRCKYCPL